MSLSLGLSVSTYTAVKQSGGAREFELTAPNNEPVATYRSLVGLDAVETLGGNVLRELFRAKVAHRLIQVWPAENLGKVHAKRYTQRKRRGGKRDAKR
jgi:hypothetical protein